MNLKRARFAIAFFLLTGCAGLIGVPDLTLEESGTDGGADATADAVARADGGADTGTSAGDSGKDSTSPGTDSGQDSATCDLSTTSTDPDNCGRCGHSCQGGTCTAGLCDAVKLTTVSSNGLRFLVEHGDYLYASTFWRAYSSDEGIFRIPKGGGPAVKFFTADYVEQMVVLGDTLYFLIDNSPFDDAGRLGGVWACDLTGPVPCVPKIVATADNANGLTGDNGTLYFRNFGSDESIWSHAVDAGDLDASRLVGTTNSNTYLYFLWSGGTDVFSLSAISPIDNERAYLSRYSTLDAGGPGEELSRYTNPVANPGGLTGTATAVYFASYDFDTTTGGVVRRVPRAGAAASDALCTYGNGTERRPAGLHVDATNLYWTNQGDPASPYGNGSVAYCAAHGACCTEPNVIWRGEGEPVAITGDDKFLYWIGYRSGDFFKVAKP